MNLAKLVRTFVLGIAIGSFGCDNNKNSHQAAVIDTGRATESDNELYDAGQPHVDQPEDVGIPDVGANLPEVCSPGLLYCGLDNVIYRCLSSGTLFEEEIDCGETTVCLPPGVCAERDVDTYVCADDVFVLQPSRLSREQFTHRGGYACESLCPGDEGLESQPVFMQARDNMSFEAPVDPHSDLVVVNVYGTHRTSPDVGVLKLHVEGQREPTRLALARSHDCQPFVIPIVDLRSQTFGPNIISDGKLSLVLEHPGHTHQAIKLHSSEIGGECKTLPFKSWSTGISKVEVVSCYKDIKTAEPRQDPNQYTLPPVCEEGVVRCFNNILEECVGDGWIDREVCNETQLCDAETGGCLNYTEECLELEEIIFHDGTAELYGAPGDRSCSSLCPQYEVEGQPLVAGRRQFVSTSYQLPDGFEDPDIVYVDLVTKFDSDSTAYVTIGGTQMLFDLYHSCSPERIKFETIDKRLAENSVLNVKISGLGWVTYNSRTRETDQFGEPYCWIGGHDFGLVAQGITICNIKYE